VAVVGEIGEQIGLSNHEGSWATGTTYSTDHIIDPPASLTVHCFLSRIQGITSGPPGAAIGVSYFRTVSGAETILGNSDTWWPILYNAEQIARFTVSFEAVRADVEASWFAQFWV
jgi:hypothetical protein